ncbi:MAG: nitronate monooxygenase [Anaerolineae bacterium]|nr:nitronate monooxygenase [Anaerolineae bacterium]
MIKTPLCELLGIEHPIVQGGMAWAATAELAAAVSNAGGLGVVGAGNLPAEMVRQELHRARQLTGRPFGANVPLFAPGVEERLQVFIDEGVAVVTAGGGNVGPYLGPLQRAGILVIPVVASVALARRLARQGVHALIAEGMESGGHIGDVATLPLVPQVVDAVDIPVIAAGGFADGRGLAAALALGAAGIQMGTRFICTVECQAHEKYKERIVRAHDRATMVTGATFGHPVRSIRGPFIRKFEELERSGCTEAEFVEFGAGTLRAAIVDGDVQKGSVMAGQAAGLVDDVPTVAELMGRIIAEAERVIRHNVSLLADVPDAGGS